jgi:hypothetical protein
MKKNSLQIGVMAIDLLVDMLHRGERGLPERPSLHMVEGSWAEGVTLRGSLEVRERSESRTTEDSTVAAAA